MSREIDLEAKARQFTKFIRAPVAFIRYSRNRVDFYRTMVHLKGTNEYENAIRRFKKNAVASNLFFWIFRVARDTATSASTVLYIGTYVLQHQQRNRKR
jgi:hypothetical protein